MKKYTDLLQHNKITAFLQNTQRSRATIRLWQSFDKTQDYSYGIIEHIDSTNRVIRFRIPKAKNIKLNPAEDLFFYSPYRNMLFKAKIRKASKHVVEIDYPNKVKIEESRSEQRTHFGLNSYHFAKILVLTQDKQKLSAKVRVLDISNSGIAFIVNSLMSNVLNVNDKIIILDTTASPTIKNNIFIVSNVIQLTNKLSYSKEFRVGLKLCG